MRLFVIAMLLAFSALACSTTPKEDPKANADTNLNSNAAEACDGNDLDCQLKANGMETAEDAQAIIPEKASDAANAACRAIKKRNPCGAKQGCHWKDAYKHCSATGHD